MIEKGLFIQIEGIDCSGKETQSKELAKRFQEDGHDVITISFPVYDSESGEILRDILEGFHPLTPKNNPLEFQALMTINRYEQQMRIEHALMMGKVVIADRYADSSIAYGMADGLEEQWISKISHSLIQPDIKILLDISIDEYRRRSLARGDLDLYEEDIENMMKVRDIYQNLAMRDDWLVITAEGDPQEIADVLYATIKQRMDEMGV